MSSDQESALGSKLTKNYFHDNDFKFQFNSSTFINRNRTVDSFIRAIRNTFENNP